MNCPKCGHDVADDAKFCNKCGASLADVPAADGLPTCKKCGYHFEAPAKFCIKCGAPVESEPAEPAASADPPKAAGAAPKQTQQPWQQQVHYGTQPSGLISTILGRMLPGDVMLAIATIMDVTFFIICLITGIITFVNLGSLMHYYHAGGFITTSIIKFILIIIVWFLLAVCASINAYLAVDVFKFSQRVKRAPTGVVSYFKKSSGRYAIAVFANGALFIFALFDLIINAIISGQTFGQIGIHGGSITLCVFMMIAAAIGFVGAVLLYKTRNYVQANANAVAQMERNAPKY